MKKIWMLFMILVSFGSAAMAQDEDNGPHNEKLESIKIAFITEKLDLNSSEAKAFWPVYNEFNDQMKKLKNRERENNNILKAKTSVTDQEADKFLSEQLSLRQQQLDLTKKYVAEFRKVLPPKKVARLLTLEQEFKMQLLQRLKDRRERMQR